MPAESSAQPNVATESAAYKTMKAIWAPMDAIMSGTRGLRKLGKAFLKQFPKETDPNYNRRLANAVLWPAYSATLDDLSRKPFIKPATLKESETDSRFLEFAKDMDMAGRDLTSIGREVLHTMMHRGFTHLLVDFPNTQAEEELRGRKLNLAEERRLNIRPYVSHVDPSSLIAWRGAQIGGRPELERIQIKETVTKADGEWGEKTESRIKVITPTEFHWYVYDTDAGEWPSSPTFEAPNTLGRIPLVTIYANRTGFMTGEPVMEDLGYLNLKLWNVQSDHDNIMHTLRVPLPIFTGWEEDELAMVDLGPNNAVRSHNVNARAEYLEHTGAGTDASFQDIERLKLEQTSIGTDMLVRRAGNETATGRYIDSTESISRLQSIVRHAETGFEQAFKLMGLWATSGARDDLPVQVDIFQDFGISPTDTDSQQRLQRLIAGAIDAQALLEEDKKAGLFSDSFDVESVLSRTQTAAPPTLLPFTPDEGDEEDLAA